MAVEYLSFALGTQGWITSFCGIPLKSCLPLVLLHVSGRAGRGFPDKILHTELAGCWLFMQGSELQRNNSRILHYYPQSSNQHQVDISRLASWSKPISCLRHPSRTTRLARLDLRICPSHAFLGAQ